MRNRVLALLGLGCALAPLAQAQFTGNYSLTPPTAQNVTTANTLGLWSFTLVGTGNGYIDTTSAPSSFVLSSSASGTGLGLNASLTLASVPQAGTISFNYNFSASTFGSTPPSIAQFTYGQNLNTNTLVTSSSNTVTWNVLAGDTIFFTAYAVGGEDMMAGGAGGIGGIGGIGGPPMGGAGAGGTVTPTTGTATVSVSNFTFTPAAIPEPADFALGGGLLALGAGAMRRRKTPAPRVH